jgi:hypothetical protein
MMDRRDFVKQLSAGMGAALAPGVLAAILSGCEAEPESAGLLTTGELDILGSLTDAIIPRTDTPGARDAGVPQYIEMMLEHFTPPDQVETFRSQLDWMSSWLAEQGARSLEDVAEEKRIVLLTALDDQAFGDGTSSELPQGEPALFAILKPLTVAGYYTSEIGATQELHTMPMGAYGDIPFDEVGRTWA